MVLTYLNRLVSENDMVDDVEENDCPVVDIFAYHGVPDGRPDSVNVTVYVNLEKPIC